MTPKFSVVIPVYGCKTCLVELYIRLKTVLEQLDSDFEILFVNDSSPDDAWETIIELSSNDNRVKGINLSRNFGQHYAIRAGLENVSGNWIILMDCDLQDQPEEISKLFATINKGYDVVIGCRQNRKDNFIKKMFSRLFYKIYDYFTESGLVMGAGNFGIYSKKVIESYNLINERNKVLLLFTKWLGYKVTFIDIEHAPRFNGKTSYSFRKLISLAIQQIIFHTNKPLILSVQFGFLLSIISFLYGIVLIIQKLFFNVPMGWTSLMVLFLFISGLLFINLGIVGLYIGKVFNEVKGRPAYIIDNKIGF
jgi:polyisoprenyl-phosphate glycosyltransferase